MRKSRMHAPACSRLPLGATAMDETICHRNPKHNTSARRKCVVLQHVMHGFPGVAIWLSCMHTSH